MLSDKTIIKAINALDDEEVKRELLRDGSSVFLLGFVREHEKAFRALLPTFFDDYMDDYREYTDETAAHVYISRKTFMAYLCLETGVVNGGDFRTVVGFTAAGVDVNDLENVSSLSSELFRDGVLTEKHGDKQLLAFLDEKPEYLRYFLPLMCSVYDPVFLSALSEYVKSAGLQDTLRVYIFRAMFDSSDPEMLLRCLDEIDGNNYYRFKALTEAAVMAGNYTAALPPKELVGVLRDAANSAVDKYYTSDFKHAYYFTGAYDRLHAKAFCSFAVDLLSRGGDRARWALLYRLSSKSVNVKYAREIFGGKLTCEDLSFFIGRIDADVMERNVVPTAFETLFRLLTGMDKVSYHYKTDGDVMFARDISKAGIIGKLAELAVRSGNGEYIRRLDGIYDTLKEEAQVRYLAMVGNKTALDTRLCAVKFLKTDNYSAVHYYDDRNIKLSYDEAVLVSDYLKTKKEGVKSKIIKAYLASPDRDKIAEYLLSRAEDYKRAAGEEIKKSRGKIDGKKLDKKTDRYSRWFGESVFTVDKPEGEIQKLAAVKTDIPTVKPLTVKQVAAFFAALDKFILDHRNHEYAAFYTEGLVTFGSVFSRLKDTEPGADGFEAYPLGGEIKALIRDNFSAETIAGILILAHCVESGNKKLYAALCGNKLFGDANKNYEYVKLLDIGYWGMNSFTVVRRLEKAVAKELLDEKTILSIYATFARDGALDKYKCDTERVYGANDYPALYCRLLTDSQNDETLKTLVCLESRLVNAGVTHKFSLDLTTKAYERGYISDGLARYFLLENESLGGLMMPSSSQCVMRSDYNDRKSKALVLDFIDRALDVEFARGSLQTQYSRLLGRTGRFYGAEKFFRAIAALRGLTWVRSPYGNEKNETLSYILKCTVKGDGDTYESFAALIDKYGITDDELLRATLFNPEFVDFTARYLGVPHLKLAVFWFIAHLNESLYGDKEERRIEQIKEFSDISYPDFKDGAFDCKWYAEMKELVPESVLKRIYADAKYVTVGGLHKRAQRFFDAYGGNIQKSECLEKIRTTRNKDYCLIYSLIPVEDRNDLYERYSVLAEFKRESKQFGAQRQLSERRTVDIALENLARAAGYASPDIFMFEMESETPSDIYKPHVAGDITITPYIDERKFKISYTVEKDGKRLSAIPSKYSKNETVVELREKIKANNQKFRRIIVGFENAMNIRTQFTTEQLSAMCREPLIAVTLGKLVLSADGKLCMFDGGLKDLDGNPIKTASVCVAHAADLKQKGLLSAAVEYVVKNNIRQPFKQALREIYTKTDAELGQDEVLRFKGFEVDLKKSVAALKGKGWGVSEDIGLRKVHYAADTVSVIFRECDCLYSADYENVNRELHGIFFLKRKSGEIMPVKDVDPITFSETLRDVDLMISVSSKVIYDFELAMSTVEVRHEVLRSIVGILGLTNVSLLKDNIRVEGQYGTYTVNIRTGLVFKDGKGNLALDTVYSKDKPILLDFVDEDPTTVDIISKAILLSNDGAVKDPSILREIKD